MIEGPKDPSKVTLESGIEVYFFEDSKARPSFHVTVDYEYQAEQWVTDAHKDFPKVASIYSPKLDRSWWRNEVGEFVETGKTP